MDDLRGSASEKLTQLNAVRATSSPDPEWVMRQLLAALEELEDIEPVADAEQDRREDY